MRKKRITMYDASTFRIDYSKLNKAETSDQEPSRKPVGKPAARPKVCTVYHMDSYRNR